MTNPTILCKTCKKPKAPYECGLCHEHICKSCAQFLETEAFSFRKSVPEELTHNCYCYNCFDDKVATPLNEYNEILDRARNIIIYTKDQTKLTRYLKRKEDPYKVENCIDEEEAVMKMAFYAAESKFNCLIDVQFVSKKLGTGSHQKSVTSATGVPITIDPEAIRGH